MKANEITLDVKANLQVDRKTAFACLKLVEIYINQSGEHIEVDKNEDGTLEFRIADRRKA